MYTCSCACMNLNRHRLGNAKLLHSDFFHARTHLTWHISTLQDCPRSAASVRLSKGQSFYCSVFAMSMAEDFSIDAEDDNVQHDTTDVEASPRFPGWTPKNIEKKRRTIFAAVALIVSGLILLIIGLILALSTAQFSAGVALIVIGCLCFVPGSYISFMLFKAFRGSTGYTLEGVPEFI